MASTVVALSPRLRSNIGLQSNIGLRSDMGETDAGSGLPAWPVGRLSGHQAAWRSIWGGWGVAANAARARATPRRPS
ncbi:hypothetical protein [Candidatus Poriferisodalis sp.]|uniref:hypothetical protein n=1 Tax=Candidatus Poriferisodalis sp. TaxID=3101277 RepID=UPI003B01D459